jgi:N-acetylneuraminic acid mutarotase
MKLQIHTISLLTLLALAGCGGDGSEPAGNGNAVNVAPSISNFVLTPAIVELNDSGGQVDVLGSFDFSEPDGNLSSVTLNIFDAAGNTLRTEMDNIPDATGVKAGTIEGLATMSTTALADFSFQVFLTDTAGLQSNRLNAAFRVKPVTWTPKAAMPSPRLEFAAAAVNDLVYVIGGRDDTVPVTPRPPTAVVEIYDPANDSWTDGPTLPEPIANAKAITVNNRIYVIGGIPELAPETRAVYEFDLATQLWTSKADLPFARSAAAAAAHAGQIYVAGGRDGGMQSNTLLRYDPSTNLWSVGSPMSHAREGSVADVIDGKILVYGGYTTTFPQDAGYRGVLESYDPVMDLWTELAPGDPRRDMGVAAFDGVLYTFGGNNVSRTLDWVRTYDSASNTWSSDKPLPVPLSYAQAVAVGDRIYVFGTSDTFEYAP